MIKVFATREGLQGQVTASGYVIDAVVPFVALPSHNALERFVRLRNPRNARTAIAAVLDVGPWNVHDDSYVFQPATMPGATSLSAVTRPQAESGTDLFGRKTNGAGIDLGQKIWTSLGLDGNADIEWEFLV